MSDRGDPRVQYSRTYVLLPPHAHASLAEHVIGQTWDWERWTVGGSADDAGIGDLDNRRVIALDPDSWQGELSAFFSRYYPGVSFCPLSWTNDYQLDGRLLAYSLKDDGLSLIYPTTHLPAYITDEFGTPRGSIYHCGLDLRSSYSVWGDEILSPVAGIVVAAGSVSGETDFGEQVRIRAQVGGQEVLIRCAHLVAGSIPVSEGDHVEPGQMIGLPDNTGVSTGDHLHLDVKVGTRYADPGILMQWPDGGQTTAFTLRGVHDRAGGDWLIEEGLSGWCLIPVYLGTDPQSLNLPAHSDVRYVVNLRYGWAVDDGGQGTIPGPDKLDLFERACIETMECNPGAWGFVYCNEMNNTREWAKGHTLTPSYYLASYNRVWARKPAGARLLPGAIDPYNPGWGDWRECWHEVLRLLAGCDGLAWHAYTHGPDPALIWHSKQFGDDPLTGVFYDLRVLESQQAIIPGALRNLPQIVTESNHYVRNDGQVGWEADSGQWVTDAYRYFASRGIIGACLFRFNFNDWKFGNLPAVLCALRNITP